MRSHDASLQGATPIDHQVPAGQAMDIRPDYNLSEAQLADVYQARAVQVATDQLNEMTSPATPPRSEALKRALAGTASSGTLAWHQLPGQLGGKKPSQSSRFGGDVPYR